MRDAIAMTASPIRPRFSPKGKAVFAGKPICSRTHGGIRDEIASSIEPSHAPSNVFVVW